MQLVVLGLNHRSAAVAVRERFSFEKDEVKAALNKIYEYDRISECVILSTCNRTELYAVLEDVEQPKQYMLDVMKDLKDADSIDESAFFFYQDRECVDHLFRVSASLDSLVLGEGQILSQLKVAYIEAYSAGFTGTVFNILFQRAISVGKKVRTNTGIANTPVSVSYTAVNLAEDSLDKPLSEATVLILGAGTMSELTAIHLQSKGVKTIFVSNRTFAKAETLAKKFNGHAIKLDDVVDYAVEADILITSTGAPHYIINEKEARRIAARRNGMPMVMIDIAVPRDIDPAVADIDGIYLFNIDALESVVEENKQQREEEAKRAEPIIHEAIEDVLDKLSYLSVRPMMALLTDKADRIRSRELHRALAKLPDISDRERRIMDSMSRMIVRKMLREPMIHFNEIAGTEEEGLYWDLFKDMFNLKKEG
ncbi:glutamyl-tRNA reductase [Veillonella agrestimuris]|uniref:glutamyl-tRNA reductase n=1 Tax=Veillonella agrestimuris TaxID=2941340 RepID=UPI0020408D13|nr:glutamyl-tRNA reductase [Veillonella agrestimuris]